MSGHVFAWSPLKVGTTNLPMVFAVLDADLTVDPNDGYNSGPALSGASLNAYGIADITPVQTVDDVMGLGMRLKITSLPATEKILLGGTRADATLIASLTVRPDGTLAVYRGNMESLLAVSPSAIATSTQLRVGFLTTLGRGAGGFTLIDVDGTTVVIQTGTDPGVADWRRWYVGSGPSIFVSHIYGTVAETLSPATLVEADMSDDANLSEADPDGDTSTRTLAAYGDQISTGLTGVGTHRAIYGIQTVAIVRGTGGFAPMLTVDGSPYVRDRQALDGGGAYTSVEQFEPVNPRTGVPWTSDDVTALEIGGEAQA